MDYCNMMKDCIGYINRHKKEELTADSLGRIHSLRGEYISYIFSCYFHDYLDVYIKKVKQKTGSRIYPQKRQVQDGDIQIRQINIEKFNIVSYPVVKSEKEIYCPIEAAVMQYEYREQADQKYVSLWWHDEEYRSHYMQGRICEKHIKERGEYIRIPTGRYAVFSMKRNICLPMAETAKQLFLYVQDVWKSQNPESEDEQGYSFHCFADNKVYYCLALKEESEKEPIDKIYGVDSWVE